MPDLVHIPGDVLEAILAHARAELPNECCGLLIGSALTIHHAVQARNLQATPTSYLVDPADHFAAIRWARTEGLTVIGAYHSHPGLPPVPSSRDLAEASFPEFVYLIVSIDVSDTAGRLRAYRLADGRATPLDVVEVGLVKSTDGQEGGRPESVNIRTDFRP